MKNRRHLLLKFNYGVEIGARLAYLGHFEATKDGRILAIANEELDHRIIIESILQTHGQTPFWLFNLFFTIVGTIIQKLCTVSPNFLLNHIAKSMEVFAVFNYTKLATIYPEYSTTFINIAKAEKDHGDFFNNYEKP